MLPTAESAAAGHLMLPIPQSCGLPNADENVGEPRCYGTLQLPHQPARGGRTRAEALASARPAYWPASRTRAPPRLPGPASLSGKRAGALASGGGSLRRRWRTLADALASARPACWPASKTPAPPRLPGPASLSAKRAGALGSEGDSLRRRLRGAGGRPALDRRTPPARQDQHCMLAKNHYFSTP